MKLLFTTTILVSVLGLVAADVPKPQITVSKDVKELRFCLPPLTRSVARC